MLPAQARGLLCYNPPKRGRSCALCKTLKVRCCGRIPCTRCWRLALRCEMPQCMEGAGGGSGGGADGSGNGAIPLLRQPGDSDEEVAGALLAAPTAVALSTSDASSWPPPPARLMRLIIQRLDPRPIAELICHCLVLKHRQGSLLRGHAVRLLRHWVWKSALCGCVDASSGVLGAVAKELGLSTAELQPSPGPPMIPERMGQGAMSHAGARPNLHAALAPMPSLQQAAAFREADRDNVALYMITPWGMDGQLVEVSNGLFAEWFRGVEGLYSDMILSGTLSELLLCALVAPEDQQAFIDLLIGLQVTRSPGRVRQFIKLFDITSGDIRLYLMEARPAETLPDGAPVGLLLRFERCPPSRHVSASRHLSIAKTFRPVERPTSPPTTAAAGSPPDSPPYDADSTSGEEEGEGEGEGVDEEELVAGGIDAAAITGQWATTVLPGAASIPVTDPPPSQAGLRALLAAPDARASLGIFKLRSPELARARDGGLVPPPPLPVLNKRQPSAFEWTRPAPAPVLVPLHKLPGPPLPALQPLSPGERAGGVVEPEPEPERRDGVEDDWSCQAPPTPGAGQVECWADGHTPIFDDDMLLALFG